jgi:predicted nucleic acid-binding protein
LTACVLDTDVLIAVLDRRDVHHTAGAEAIRAMAEDDIRLLVSLINYAETLVRPADDERTFAEAVRAIEALGVELVPPTAAMARDAARLRGLNVSLADGFALATARAHGASVASFDRRVRRALAAAGIPLAPELR